MRGKSRPGWALFPTLETGERIEAEGYFTEHATYGRQFQISSYELKAPEDEVAIERYLGSGAIKGIGVALAARIVRRFQADTFRVIEEETGETGGSQGDQRAQGQGNFPAGGGKAGSEKGHDFSPAIWNLHQPWE